MTQNDRDQKPENSIDWVTFVWVLMAATGIALFVVHYMTTPAFVLSRVNSDPEICVALGGTIDADELGETMCLTPCDTPP